MYTLYDFINKFKFEDFEIFSATRKNEKLVSNKINHNDLNDAIRYFDTAEEKALSDYAEHTVVSVDFMKNIIYIED